MSHALAKKGDQFFYKPLPTQLKLLMTLRKMPFENIVEKAENAGCQHFLLFPQSFLLYQDEKCHLGKSEFFTRQSYLGMSKFIWHLQTTFGYQQFLLLRKWFQKPISSRLLQIRIERQRVKYWNVYICWKKKTPCSKKTWDKQASSSQ